MAREFKRADRVGAELRRELAELMRGIEQERPEIGMVTIQEARVSRDIAHARVFFTRMGGALEPVQAEFLLNEFAGRLRHELGQRMRMRSVPALKFVYDTSIERGAHLSALIDEVVPKPSSNDNEDD